MKLKPGRALGDQIRSIEKRRPRSRLGSAEVRVRKNYAHSFGVLREIHSSERSESGANHISQPHLGQRKVTASSWRLPLTLMP